jgi:hypothetical protein
MRRNDLCCFSSSSHCTLQSRKARVDPGMPASKYNYAFISSAPKTRWSASHGPPPLPPSPWGRHVKLYDGWRHRSRLDLRTGVTAARPPSQQTERKPRNDWDLLMSAHRGQKRLVQRPWPEYVPESSAPVGRTWECHNLSTLRETMKTLEARPSSRSARGLVRPISVPSHSSSLPRLPSRSSISIVDPRHDPRFARPI